ncbi:MAG: HDOD domain-containing protein [candidate division Zixibacteria bacterium]|nr:HDOD domain-containing protein [candidate division Zixibacteria bacterium]
MSSIDQATVVRHIREGTDLMSLPQSLSDVLKETGNPNFNAESLSRLILRDPALTGRILRVANSSFYSRFANIKTVHQAVQLLGVNSVKCLALSTSIFRPEKIHQQTGIDAQALFSHFLTVAAGSDMIAKAIGHKNPEEAFVAGLLHDIGLMYLLETYPQQYRRVLQRQAELKSSLAAEVELFGLDHTEAGYHLATRWRLPEYICDAVRMHHRHSMAGEVNVVGRCVMLAILLAPGGYPGFIDEIEEKSRIRPELAASLGLSRPQTDAISVSMMRASMEIAAHMEIDIGSTEDILARANREIWQTYLTVENLYKERQELTAKLLAEERQKGALESKNIAISTLSHYLNNAAMAVYGRSQILRMVYERGDTESLIHRLPESLDVIDRSIKKIVAVVTEIKTISPIDHVKFLDTSQALNIDDRVERRLQIMEKESGLILPDDAMVEDEAGASH